MERFAFGRSTQGGTAFNFPYNGNGKSAGLFALAADTQISSLFAYWSNGIATAKVRGVIYADVAGAPGALLAVTSERVNAMAGWNRLPFGAPVALTAGSYWLGVISDSTIFTYGEAGGTGARNADTYSDGPTDPFGAYTATTIEPPIYAAYVTEDSAVSKAVAYSALSTIGGISKALGYAVLSTEVNVSVSKAVAFAVLAPPHIGLAPVATSTNTVRVTTDMIVYALDPRFWGVVRLDTGASLGVLHVTQVSDYVYDLTLRGHVGPTTVNHSVTYNSTLTGISGTGYFLGITVPVVYALREEFTMLDLKMLVGGTLAISSGGDYVSIGGAELLKKLIIRRLMTRPGDFFHLPNYGLSFMVKQPLPTSDMIRLKAEVERQVKMEPEVKQVRADVSVGPNNLVLVQLRIASDFGTLAMDLPLS